MSHRLIPMLLILALTLTGCSGGSVYSNYRELEQLSVIGTVGFDTAPDGVTLSVSAGEGVGGSLTHMHATAGTVELARERLQDYSQSEELFFAHTAYLAVGEDTAGDGLAQYLDYVARAPDLRLGVPLFVVAGDSAESLVTRSDAESVFRSVERDIKKRGECPLPCVSDIVSSLDLNGCALAVRVKAAPADEVITDSKPDELTAIPDGLQILKNARSVGYLDSEGAFGVSVITGSLGPAVLMLETADGRASVSIDGCECEVTPLTGTEGLYGLGFDVSVRAALRELDGTADESALSSALENEVAARCRAALYKSRELACDFMRLGALLERKSPHEFAGLAAGLSSRLPSLEFRINVSAELRRSFDIDADE